MIENYIKVALRNIASNKLTSAINIFGLSLGIACCVLLYLFILDETTHDDFHQKLDRIYRVNLDMAMHTGDTLRLGATQLPLIPHLVETFEEIAAGTRFSHFRDVVKSEQLINRELLTFVDPDFFEIFSFNIIEGERSPLSDPSGVVLTADMARKYLGGESPIGKELSIKLRNEFKTFRVSAIIEDPPSNSSLRYGLILHTSHLTDVYNDDYLASWIGADVASYLLLTENSNPDALNSRLNPSVSTFVDTSVYRFSMQPFSGIYLDDSKAWTLERTSARRYSYILSFIAAVILLIACFNFTNLAIARASTRAREIGIRKSIGADRKDLALQFMGESILMALIAMLVGIALAELFLPVFNKLTAKHLSLVHSPAMTTAGALLAIAVVAGTLAGLYPALIVSNLKPVSILRNRLRIGGDNFVTRAFIVVQFAVTLALLTSTLIMTRQVSYMKTRDLGFDDEQLVSLNVNSPDADRIFDRFKEEASGIPSVLSLSKTDASIIGSYNFICNYSEQGAETFSYMYRVDPEFDKTLGVEMARGRFFSSSLPTDVNAVVVNETYLQEFDIVEPVGQTVHNCLNDQDMTIIGVVKDFHFSSLRQSINPAVLYIDSLSPIRYFYARISPDDIPGTIDRMKSIWASIAPDVPFDYSFVDEFFNSLYYTEERWTSIIRCSALLTATIACLGLFGLSALATRRRAREISIRKVHGAGLFQIVRLMNARITVLIFAAVAIAVPVTYIIMADWLETFAYRITVSPLVFVFSFTITLLLATFTVTAQTIRAALSNPVDTLRSE